MSMQNKKSDSYFSRNKKWLNPLVILAFCLLSSQVWKIIGESNVLPRYIIKIVATIALFICAFHTRMIPTVSARIIVTTFYFGVFGVFGLLILIYFRG
ncbi:TPA: hypothetical protein MCU51_004325 [Klebsiella pneumoniae]|nr:hypothetical protein [Klebsiella pneumoniae]HBT7686568.1 hypothetical protein [Klebsiella pneumoniae]HBT9035623.1 hypothetical protein [Klebsiella pneumoniae]HBT9311936.1 hypothetical protein [Klebsiella pneumoniae]HBU2399437.1 hypothetical protein [Klebsiella pneumoniae]